MFNYLIRKMAAQRAQKIIDKLEPQINVKLPLDLPLPSTKIIKDMCASVSQINQLEPQLKSLSDEALGSKTSEFRRKYEENVGEHKKLIAQIEDQYKRAAGTEEKKEINLRLDAAYDSYHKAKQEFLRSILPEAFAAVREASSRTLGLRHFDVQMIGGMVLNSGGIAEMTTGEGKTLVATLAAYLNSIPGDGVHVVTVNDYLAKRDREWMGPIYEFMGLTVGVIQHDMMPSERKVSYDCDITYGTNNEFGFDYLRDNMVSTHEDMVQRKHHFAIVDEVDSILIDEARTPLIISGPAEESTDKYYRADVIARKLKGRRITEKEEIDAKYNNINLAAGYDYLAEEKGRSISLTEEGETKIAEMFGIANLHDMETIDYRHHILSALRAHEFFKQDVDYVLREGQVIIVDEFTGRLMPGRRWSDGLHQAVEAKEGIKIERENQTLATITLQNYFRMYEKLSGMTGTAYTEASEFKHIYDLDVVTIPTNKPMQRKNFADAVYRSEREKFLSVVEDIAESNKRGQPVLVGTISIEKSERLSRMLQQRGVKHQVLNAKYHEREAHIIAQAGRYGAVTIATNMAGRGTDIVLGGNAEYLAKMLVEEKSKEEQDEEKKAALVKKFVDQFRQQCKEEQSKVREQGGLYVIGTERHESRRIDNQLRGRQGRQGDPGSSRFYISLEDDLMRLFGSERIIGIMNALGMEEGQVLEHPMLTGQIEGAQKRVEQHNFEIRKHLLEYDDVMNRQREVIYDMRRAILDREDASDVIYDGIEEISADMTAQYLFSGAESGWDINGLEAALQNKFGVILPEDKDSWHQRSQEAIAVLITEMLTDAYRKKEETIDPGHLRHLERIILMHTIDAKWKDHLYAMDQLKEGIGLRSYAQRDPLIEFKREAFEMFQVMYASIKDEVVEVMFKIKPSGQETRMRSVFGSIPMQTIHNEATGMASRQAASEQSVKRGEEPQAEENHASTIKNDGPKVGRNDPCPCGSGLKYKKCHGK